MSQEEVGQIGDLISRVEKLVKFAYFVGSALFLLGVWVAGQQFTDDYQWRAINANKEEIKARGEWMKETEERLIRIDERTLNTNQQVAEIKALLSELRKQ